VDLLVLAKEPVPGRVKTRLSPPCTADQAARIATAALMDTLAAAMASTADRVVVGLDGAVGPWCPPTIDVVDQGRGALSDRLEKLWDHAEGPTLQIGMDTPQAGAGLLDDAFARLVGSDVDAVLGLAFDGGWWAIGLARPVPGVFTGIETSQADTGLRTLARLRSLGLRVALLSQLRDVDTWADALAVRDAAPGSAFARAVDDVSTVLA
jgi:glycosyltransferase A (GT-A) superfamily protein (DUF2064 family)